MKLVKHNRYQIVLQAAGKEILGNSFVVDTDLLIPCQTAFLFRIENVSKHKIKRWTMTYKMLLRETCVGVFALIDKSRFKYSEIRRT